jgi:hypothetical protein
LLWTPRKIREDIGKEESAMSEKRANEGTRTPEWWNHNPLP